MFVGLWHVPGRRLPAAAGAALFVLAFGAALAAARAFDRAGVLGHYNILFDADPVEYLGQFVHGASSTARHPLIFLAGLILAPIARLVAAVAHLRAEDAPRAAALLIAPLANGLRAALTAALLVRFGLTLRDAALFAAASTLSLASVTVGAIPESFALSSVFLVAFAWLAVDDSTAWSWRRTAVWTLVGAAAGGVTITNLAPLVIFVVAAQAPPVPWRQRISRAASVGLIAAALIVIVAAAGSLSFGRAIGLHSLTDWRRDTARVHPLSDLPVAMSLTFVTPVAPDVVSGHDPASPSADAMLRELSYAGALARSTLLSIWIPMWAGLLAWGAWRGVHDARMAPLVWAAIAVLGFNTALHTVFFGSDLFLFALHWQPAQLILLAGLGVGRGRGARGALMLTSLATIVTSAGVWWWIVQRAAI
jgi:hypothetical protein